MSQSCQITVASFLLTIKCRVDIVLAEVVRIQWATKSPRAGNADEQSGYKGCLHVVC